MTLPETSQKRSLKTVIITGLSGAGKSTAMHALEDIGFYCVDNLPVFLLKDFLHTLQKDPKGPDRLALVMDARDASFHSAFQKVSADLTTASCSLELFFLEAEEDVLVRRFSQMRRRHPLAEGGTLRQGIARERERLAGIRKDAGALIDTSNYTPHELRRLLQK
ncbi:MAG: RNase adaptor protein RapZ, partial [Desulfobulbaceae bacterium]|nr:RNase adaptor protein RapZ [Desulfobulbaceae bacterium]